MGLYNANGHDDEGSRVFFQALPLEDYPAGIIPTIAPKQVKGIYTLTGLRINSITSPGLYIIDGKKVVVSNPHM